MKHLISIIKFFNKRELWALCAECRNRSSINGLVALNSKGIESHYFRGKAAAYKEMEDFIEKRIKDVE